MRIFIAAVVLLATLPATAGAKVMSDEAAAAARTVDAFHDALHRGDTSAAARLIGNDALIFEDGYVERDKAAYAAHHLHADADFSKAVSSVLKSRTGGSDGNLAWVASEWQTTGTYRGKAINSVGTETMLLRRESGIWKVAHIHWSSHAAKVAD